MGQNHVGSLTLAVAGLAALVLPLVLHVTAIGPPEALSVTAFVLILVGAVIVERRVRARLVRSAVLAERRRVARDLHDGIAQDLAFIAAHEAQIANLIGAEHPLVASAQRALATSRTAISDLSDAAGPPSPNASSRAVHMT